MLAWLCWVLIATLLYGQWRMRVVHFHFLPFAALFLAMLTAVMATEVLAVRKWRRGAPRRRTLALAALGLVPLAFFAATCGYGAYQARYAVEPDDVFFKFAVGVAASTMEGQVRVGYANRLETKRLVMYYDQLESPESDAQLMDRYIARLEAT